MYSSLLIGDRAVSLDERLRVVDAFRRGVTKVLICTDGVWESPLECCYVRTLHRVSLCPLQCWAGASTSRNSSSSSTLTSRGGGRRLEEKSALLAPEVMATVAPPITAGHAALIARICSTESGVWGASERCVQLRRPYRDMLCRLTSCCASSRSQIGAVIHMLATDEDARALQVP